MQNKIRNIFRDIKIDVSTGLITVQGVPTKSHFVSFAPAAPVVADVDRVVTSVAMKVGAYSVANASAADALCHNVTVTVTATGGVDTMGIITVTGTDYNDETITEILTPVAGSTVSGNRAFKTVTAIVGADWVVDSGTDYDLIEVGFGNKIGFPRLVKNGDICFVVWNQAIVSTATPTYSRQISLCTITPPEAGNGTKKIIVGMLQYTGN